MLFEFNLFERFFTTHDKVTDSYKNNQGKGLLERYNECIGADIDNELKPLIDNLLINILPPATALGRYVPFLESGLGFKRRTNNLYFSQNIQVRREILEVIDKLDGIRGTSTAYDILFAMLGMSSTTITEYPAGYGFDSHVTFDDDDRTFDSMCPSCSDYSIDLTGSLTINQQILDAITSIITYNQPINARLRDITYNGSSLFALPDFNTDFNTDFL